MASGPVFFTESPLIGDICALALSTCLALSLLRLFEETARRGVFHQKLNRKLLHLTIGLAFMSCWPLFSSGSEGALIAAIVPGVNIIKVLLIGLGIIKDEATVKSMTRFGNHRELLTGPLYYACTVTLCSIIYWRTSPIAIAAICNLCAGDGFADIIGRKFGKKKIPYNTDKSFAGSIAMAIAGFIVSVGYMYYFWRCGFVERSWEMVVGFLVVSVVSTLVESHPISTKLDDNLTVPLASILAIDGDGHLFGEPHDEWVFGDPLDKKVKLAGDDRGKQGVGLDRERTQAFTIKLGSLLEERRPEEKAQGSPIEGPNEAGMNEPKKEAQCSPNEDPMKNVGA